MKKPIIGVLGAGAMGQRIVRDLLNTFNGSIVVIGRSIFVLKKKFAKDSKRLEFRAADVTMPASLVRALRGVDVVIHAVHHEYNIAVMQACLKTKTNYLDLGGLYHYTRKQLKLHRQFQRAKLMAVLGMGASPGITNIIAAYGARDFERVDAVEIRIGTGDFSTYRCASPLDNSYSLQTILEELSWPAALCKRGKIIFVDPLSEPEQYVFPAPVGKQKLRHTIHSELATLPKTLHAKNVSFQIAFSDSLIETVQMLRSLGMLDPKNIAITTAILQRLPRAIPRRIQQYEVIEVTVRGSLRGKKRSLRIEAHVATKGETVDKDTAVPASIVGQMMAKGECLKFGVFPPEQVVPAKRFFEELRTRDIRITTSSQ